MRIDANRGRLTYKRAVPVGFGCVFAYANSNAPFLCVIKLPEQVLKPDYHASNCAWVGVGEFPQFQFHIRCDVARWQNGEPD